MKIVINPNLQMISSSLYVQCVPPVVVQTFAQLYELEKKPKQNTLEV